MDFSQSNRMQYPAYNNNPNTQYHPNNTTGTSTSGYGQQQQQYGQQHAGGNATRIPAVGAPGSGGGGMMQQERPLLNFGQPQQPQQQHQQIQRQHQQIQQQQQFNPPPPSNYSNSPLHTPTASVHQSPHITTMAAPQHSTAHAAQQSPIPQSPSSTSSPALEQQRIALLLEINTSLLQEIVVMQEQGAGGDVQSPSTKAGEEGQGADGVGVKKEASKEYVECMRRMQANLAYLANVAERNNRPTSQQLPHPPIMIPPTLPTTTLTEQYTKLQSLFPAWKAQAQAKSTAQSPVQPAPNSIGQASG
ncbi:hypothetical protein EJ08DRAFT_655780 [Tothia fuscella]|uniref:Uncharacterized protein n=1 Tax=Tothia fuscella TaxID=1048955 RepID=A0A9P4U3Y3_9PEZI|nr:hypothetical protein EJ08DRAFT_655780 [Tothia fuscella]